MSSSKAQNLVFGAMGAAAAAAVVCGGYSLLKNQSAKRYQPAPANSAAQADIPTAAESDDSYRAENNPEIQRLCAQHAPTLYERTLKRACDVAIGTVAMVPVSLVIAASAVAIKYEDKGPVFYNAPRVGQYGREFTMYKLRSMKVNAPDLVMDDGSTYNGADDPRMTRVGAFLRKTSLDEMPQFINVLKGDMSVVGPRPDLQRETQLYQGEEGLKLAVKPGITGYAAVYGRNSLPWHERLKLDVYYVKNVSPLLDAKVFLKTFATVFKQEGIYVEDAPAAGENENAAK